MKHKILFLVMALTASPALAQSPAANPFIGNGQAVQQGRAVYDKTCTACHGAEGGAGERAPAIVSGAASGLREEFSETQILGIIRNGIPGTAMPAWSGRLADGDILKIAAYIHALRGTAIDDPLPGDPVHGQEVFWNKGGCGGCHMILGRGAVLGPDLSNIAAVRKFTAIKDALTKADHRVYGDGGVHDRAIAPMNYEPVTVVTRAGETLHGLMMNQDAYSVQFLDMNGKPHSFDRKALTSIVISKVGLMPTDYDKRLTKSEFDDLMAFLTRQAIVVKPAEPARKPANPG
jgi:putative heme-binding domain-containing protein